MLLQLVVDGFDHIEIALVQLERVFCFFLLHMMARNAQCLNDVLLLLEGFLEDLVEALVHKANKVADDALLPLNGLRHLVNPFLVPRVSLLQLEVLVNHVHLLLLENSHHVLTLLFEEVKAGLASSFLESAKFDFMRLFHLLHLLAQVVVSLVLEAPLGLNLLLFFVFVVGCAQSAHSLLPLVKFLLPIIDT